MATLTVGSNIAIAFVAYQPLTRTEQTFTSPLNPGARIGYPWPSNATTYYQLGSAPSFKWGI